MTGPPPAPAAGSRFARSVWLVLRKDLTVEVRSGEIAYTTLFFAASCVLIFAFALVKEGRAPEGGAAGILWIAILFATTLALGRGFERERQSETLRALLLAPVPRPAIYVGKLLGHRRPARRHRSRPVAARRVSLHRAPVRPPVLAGRHRAHVHRGAGVGGHALRRHAGAGPEPRHAAARCCCIPSWFR